MSNTRPSANRAASREMLRPSPQPPATSERARFITTLAREQHRQLRQLALDERLDASAIVRGALELIASDPTIQAQVIEAARRQTW